MKILFCQKCADIKRIRSNFTDFQSCKCGRNFVIYENDTLRCSVEARLFEISMEDMLLSIRDKKPITFQWLPESEMDRDLAEEPDEEE